MNPLTCQVAVVTGAGKGLGRAFAVALARAGASVAVVARSAPDAAGTVGEIESSGGRAIALGADVSDFEQVADLVPQVLRRLGPVDILVNNAGHEGPIGPLWETDVAEWWRTFEVNLGAAFAVTHAFLPGMIACRRGRIINISSGAGAVAIPYLSAYVTSKAALTRFSEVLAAEIKPHGLSAFAIEPGTVRTAMTERVLSSPSGRQYLPWFKEIFDHCLDIPREQAADLVLFLASGQADALSGCFISRSDDLAALLAQHPGKSK